MAPVSNPTGGATEPSLTLLHGFTNTSETWGAFHTLLSQAYGVKALDLPGHGENRDSRVSLVDYGRDLAGSLEAPTVLVGYSLGGRIALHCALERPQHLRGLVLIGATAGIDDDDERAARKRSDDQLAAKLRASQDVSSFLDEWLRGPLFAHLSSEQHQRLGRLKNSADGLASSLELMGVGNQRPLWSQLPTIDVPTLVIAGGDDQKFTALGLRLTDAIPDARFQPIVDAGHAVYAEQPERVAQAIIDFVAGISSTP
jgi:2-succinyl-6-hydroxy-2,4-cyclohexadiene-1-carboxylate synthase